jgi:hypothetical protein
MGFGGRAAFGRWSFHSGELSAGARKGAAQPASVGARGGAGRLNGCGQGWRRELDADGSTGGAAEHGSRDKARARGRMVGVK